MLRGKKIILGITGSIAAYKSVYLMRYLLKEGAFVRVIMTDHSTEFVSPLTFSALSGDKVMTRLFENDNWENHVMLGRWADLLLVAPATCNTIAAMSSGFCDNLLLAVYLSATCPVMIAPAMDEDMWQHPTTRRNIQKLMYDKVKVLKVGKGPLASGLTGEGRMSEPEDILLSVKEFFSRGSMFKDKKVLVTAGPTIEPIDPVRFISNHSTGKMGISIANAFSEAGAVVTLVCGPAREQVHPAVNTIGVTTAAEMFDACMKDFDVYDIIVMTAAVADYTPQQAAKDKIKKRDEGMVLKLVKTRDILQAAGQRKSDVQILVGFALETQNEKENARQKLFEKNADFIILNSLNDEGAGFGTDTNKISILGKEGQEIDFPLKTKKELASDIVIFLSEFIQSGRFDHETS